MGEWDVFGPQERQVGRSSITPLYDGGVSPEHWRGDGEVEGHSLTAYDASTDRWHQTWVDSTGGLLLLDGRLVDGAMVLEGSAVAADGGASQRQRITWDSRAGRRTPALGDLRRRRLHLADGLRRPLPAPRGLTRTVGPLDIDHSVRIY